MANWLQNLFGGGNQTQAQPQTPSQPRSNNLAFVGPYSPEAYDAANIINRGGTGTPYTGSVIGTGHEILEKQPGTNNPPAPDQGSSGPQAADRSRSIAAQNSRLAQLDPRLNTSLSGINSEYDRIMGGYADDTSRYTDRFNESMGSNSANLNRNTHSSLLNAAQGLAGLRRTLASIGGLHGSNVDVANMMVQRTANQDLSGAHDAFNENKTALTGAMSEYEEANRRREEEAKLARNDARAQAEAAIAQERQRIFNQLSDDYSAQLNDSEANRYAQQARALDPQLASLANPRSLHSQALAFNLPELANYIGGRPSTSVSVAAPQGGSPSALPSLLASQRRRDELA